MKTELANSCFTALKKTNKKLNHSQSALIKTIKFLFFFLTLYHKDVCGCVAVLWPHLCTKYIKWAEQPPEVMRQSQ